MASRRRARTMRPWLFTHYTRNSNSNPPQNSLRRRQFPDELQVPDERGLQQLIPWGGGSYTFGIDAARSTTEHPTDPFNPQLIVASISFHTAAAPELHDRQTRQNCRQPEAAGDRGPAAPAAGDADLAVREERVLRSGQRHRAAAGGAGVAGPGESRCGTTEAASRSAPSRRSISSRRRPKSRAPKSR